MRFLFLIFFIKFSFSGFAQLSIETQVLEAEKQRFAAMVAKDYVVLDKTISDDLVYVHSSGMTDTKSSFIEAIRKGTSSYERIEIKEAKVRVYNRQSGIINGVCIYHRLDPNGKANNLQLRYTSIYQKKKKNNWQMVSWQSFKMN